MQHKSDKRVRTFPFINALRRFLEIQKSPLLFENEGGFAVITGYRDSLIPKAEIPSFIADVPVRRIRSRTFLQCDFLEEVHMKDGTESIEANAFSSCERLAKVYMADSVRTIGRNAFFECTNLYDVKLSQTLNEIGARAFFGCTGLRDITLPDSLTVIGEEAFRGCTRLTSIHLPLALKSIPRSAFDGCTALASIYLEKGSPADKIFSQSEFFSSKLRYIPRI